MDSTAVLANGGIFNINICITYLYYINKELGINMSQQAIISSNNFNCFRNITYGLIYYDFKKDSAKKSAKK